MRDDNNMNKKQELTIFIFSLIITFVVLMFSIEGRISLNYQTSDIIFYFVISLVTSIAIITSIKKKGLKSFLIVLGILIISASIIIIYVEENIKSSGLPGLVRASEYFLLFTAVIATIIIAYIINPLIRKFYLKED